MNRKENMIVTITDEMFDSDKALILDMICESQIEADCLTKDFYIKEEKVLDFLRLGCSKKVKLKGKIPKFYEKLDGLSTTKGVYTLDNKFKYAKVDLSEIEFSTPSELYLKIPKEDTKVTLEFINALSTKTNLVIWLKQRNICEGDLDEDTLKDQLFINVKKHFNIGEDND